MKQLHPAQLALLDLLKTNQDNPLSIRDMQQRLELSSPSHVHHHIKQLERLGYLRRNPSNPQDYIVLQEPDESIAYVNLYGLAQCGKGGMLVDENPKERVPISSSILGFPSNRAFMVRALGNSMLPLIHDGDIVIGEVVKDANNGDIIICSSDNEGYIKKIFYSKKQIILHSLNEGYKPFIAENFYLAGIVRGVLKYPRFESENHN